MQANINQQNKPKTDDPIVDILAGATIFFGIIGVVKTIDWLLSGDDSQFEANSKKRDDLFADFDEETIINSILKEKML